MLTASEPDEAVPRICNLFPISVQCDGSEIFKFKIRLESRLRRVIHTGSVPAPTWRLTTISTPIPGDPTLSPGLQGQYPSYIQHREAQHS